MGKVSGRSNKRTWLGRQTRMEFSLAGQWGGSLQASEQRRSGGTPGRQQDPWQGELAGCHGSCDPRQLARDSQGGSLAQKQQRAVQPGAPGDRDRGIFAVP